MKRICSFQKCQGHKMTEDLFQNKETRDTMEDNICLWIRFFTGEILNLVVVIIGSSFLVLSSLISTFCTPLSSRNSILVSFVLSFFLILADQGLFGVPCSTNQSGLQKLFQHCLLALIPHPSPLF